ncbi:MAG TPA: 2-hydroxyacid dehydrogenase [Terriglobales bacterium]|jgi:phosphoglycerate dehydrogenase-like enzyme|nr:2-hydroxyacid dehydrogenase [Terriglobales bacterium]
MKILLHYSAGPAWLRDIKKLAAQGLDVDCCDELDDQRFYELLPDAEVIWHALRPITAADIARAPKLRLIQKIGVGVNTIDLEASKARGIAVCNMPGSNARAVAEMALLLMLACLRRLPMVDRATREGRGWKLDPALQDSYGELGGRTVGLVGFGSIPKMLVPILHAAGASVLYTATEPKEGSTEIFRRLPELLKQSDIVSLHVPLTPTSAGMIGREQLASMRPASILINTARGGLVDSAALAEALKSGHIGAAGLDVFATEPVSPTDPLLALENVVLAPHVAWLTTGTLERSLAIAVENCTRLNDGNFLLHRVV